MCVHIFKKKHTRQYFMWWMINTIISYIPIFNIYFRISYDTNKKEERENLSDFEQKPLRYSGFIRRTLNIF